MFYVNSKKRNGLTRTLSQHEKRDIAELQMHELTPNYPEPDWELWVSTQASFEWLHRQGDRDKAKRAKWGYKLRANR